MPVKYSDLEVPQDQRDRALLRFHKQIAEWNLTMPDVKHLVGDLGLRNFDKIGLIEFWVANELDIGYCGKFLFVFEGQQCPCHYHKIKHETFFVVKGQVRMTVDGEARIMKEGSHLVMPTGTKHSFEGVGGAVATSGSISTQRTRGQLFR